MDDREGPDAGCSARAIGSVIRSVLSGRPKTAVLNSNLDDLASGIQGGKIGNSEVPGWTAGSGDAVIARPPSGLDAGPWAMLLRGRDGDRSPDVAVTDAWIPIEGGAYQLSACMRRESASDNVLVDFDDGKGRDADFADVHLVAPSTGLGSAGR